MRRLPRRLRYGEEATLVEHLGELRGRLVISLLAITVGFSVSFAFHEHIVRWLTEPLPERHERLTTLSPGEPFITSITISIWAGFVCATPIVLYQFWAFFAPAFTDRTQRVVVGLSAFAGLLGAAGVYFGYRVVLPAAVKFLTNYDDEIYNIDIRAREYYSFALWILVATAILFEIPVVVLGLVRIGVLSHAKLRKNRRIGIVLMVAAAAAMPGVDPVTMMINMVPLILLFEGSIWLALFFEKRWRAQAADREADDEDDELDDVLLELEEEEEEETTLRR
jgi:sec-independent protein translocase protein TatC